MFVQKSDRMLLTMVYKNHSVDDTKNDKSKVSQSLNSKICLKMSILLILVYP